jgi:hypothetical protein
MEILKEIKNLQLVDHNYEGSVSLPCWADYKLSDGLDNKGNFSIYIGQEVTNDHLITTEDANGYATVSSWAEDHQLQILQKLFEEYPKWQPDYGYSPEEAVMFMPDAKSIEDFKNLIQLQTIHILPIAYQGTAYVGYEFNCQWDVEHGLGAMFHNKRLVDFGFAESSFLIWKANQDIEAQMPKEPSKIIFDKIAIQQSLYAFTVKAFKERVIERPNINNIYVLAYDYDLVYNKIHVSLNTLTDFETTLSESKQTNTDLSDKQIHEIKFNPGNYMHCAFDTHIPLSLEQHTQLENWITASDNESLRHWQENHDVLHEAFAETLAIYNKGEEIKLLPVTSDVRVLSFEINGDLTLAEARIKKYL